MKYEKILLLVVGMILFSCTVLAVPPVTQEFIGDVGLTLENPLVSFLKQGRDVIAHLHVYNSSSGFPMTNESTSCFLDIYNETGYEIFRENYSYVHNEWELNISGGNFSGLGEYGFLIQCNTAEIGGFVRGRVKVTESGMEESVTGGGTLIGIILFGITFIFMGLAVAFKDSRPWMIFFFLFGFLMMIVDLRFAAMIIQSNSNISNMVGNLNMLYTIFVPILIFMLFLATIYLFIKAIKSFDKRGREEMIREVKDNEMVFPK